MMMWAFIIAAGLVTYGIRLTFILVYRHIKMPKWFERGLRYVPAAVLSAILVPDLLTWKGSIDLSLQNPQIAAGVAAALIAWRTRNVLFTLASGGAVYLVLLRFLS